MPQDSKRIESHRALIVWQKAMALAADVYRLARTMAKAEEYRRTSRLLRSAASVPANIAEGHARGTSRDYANFVGVARGSLAETETFLLLASSAELLEPKEIEPAIGS
jgi:four helix bundle protein